ARGAPVCRRSRRRRSSSTDLVRRAANGRPRSMRTLRRDQGSSMQLSDIDLLDRDQFTKGIPHDWFTFLRKEAPVYKHPEPDGPGFWVVTKYADVVTVGRDAHTFSSDADHGGVIGLEEQEMEVDFGDAKIMLMMDPPQHTRQRKLVNRGFTPRMIN